MPFTDAETNPLGRAITACAIAFLCGEDYGDLHGILADFNVDNSALLSHTDEQTRLIGKLVLASLWPLSEADRFRAVYTANGIDPEHPERLEESLEYWGYR